MATKLDPSHVWAYNKLCWYGSLLGDVANVASACDRAFELEPDSPYIRDSRGLARALQGDYPGAIDDFKFFVNLASKNPSDFSRSDVKLRDQWILALEAGANPFNPSELHFLLKQECLRSIFSSWVNRLIIMHKADKPSHTLGELNPCDLDFKELAF